MAKAKPVSQLAGGVAGATATPSVASEAAAPRASSGASAMAPSAGTAVAEPAAAAAAPAPKPAPKTKFSKRATRGLKSAPAYMSFDDVDIEGGGTGADFFFSVMSTADGVVCTDRRRDFWVVWVAAAYMRGGGGLHEHVLANRRA